MNANQRGLPPPEDWSPETVIFAVFAGPTGVLAACGLYNLAALYLGLLIALIIAAKHYG